MKDYEDKRTGEGCPIRRRSIDQLPPFSQVQRLGALDNDCNQVHIPRQPQHRSLSNSAASEPSIHEHNVMATTRKRVEREYDMDDADVIQFKKRRTSDYQLEEAEERTSSQKLVLPSLASWSRDVMSSPESYLPSDKQSRFKTHSEMFFDRPGSRQPVAVHPPFSSPSSVHQQQYQQNRHYSTSEDTVNSSHHSFHHSSIREHYPYGGNRYQQQQQQQQQQVHNPQHTTSTHHYATPRLEQQTKTLLQNSPYRSPSTHDARIKQDSYRSSSPPPPYTAAVQTVNKLHTQVVQSEYSPLSVQPRQAALEQKISHQFTQQQIQVDSDSSNPPDSPSNIPVKSAQKFRRGWTKDEHIRFLIGVYLHGRGNWKAISKLINGKSPKQVQSHAQKYFLRQGQAVKSKRSIHDFNFTDLMKLVSDSRYRSNLMNTDKDLFMLFSDFDNAYQAQQVSGKGPVDLNEFMQRTPSPHSPTSSPTTSILNGELNSTLSSIGQKQQ